MEKQEQTTSRKSTWEEITKIAAEINKIEMKKYEELIKWKVGSLKRDKLLAKFTKRNRKSNRHNERLKGDITTDTEGSWRTAKNVLLKDTFY